MDKMFIFAYVFIANTLVTTVNSFASKIQDVSLWGNLKFLAMMFVPIMVYNLCFLLYFSHGSKHFSFGLLGVTSVVLAIVLSFLANIFVFKQSVNLYEVAGIFVILAGVGLMYIPKLA